MLKIFQNDSLGLEMAGVAGIATDDDIAVVVVWQRKRFFIADFADGSDFSRIIIYSMNMP